MLDKLDNEYGKVGKMTIRRGAVHDYLGMRFDFYNPGKVIIMIDMQDYIDEILQQTPDGECRKLYHMSPLYFSCTTFISLDVIENYFQSTLIQNSP
jgi:hypothetical protein